MVLRLCGSEKRTQDADIARAVRYWQDWQGRTDDERGLRILVWVKPSVTVFKDDAAVWMVSDYPVGDLGE